MTKVNLVLSGIFFFICLFISTEAKSQVDGKEVARGLGLSSEEIAQMEDGDVLAFSDAAYENTNRDLAADAIVLIDAPLEKVLETLNDETTLVPDKVFLDDGTIFSEADLASIGFTNEEFDAVEDLFAAKAGEDFNFSASEFAAVKAKLDPHRKSDRSSKVEAASAAIRDVLIERYGSYQTAGLEGIEPFQRKRGKQLDIGHELRIVTEAFQAFEDEFPEYVQEVQSFPVSNGCCDHEFRWLKLEVRERPVFVLSHKIQQASSEFILITERYYYVSNASVNNAQITFAWLPYGEGTYMGVAVSASTDILDSMMGRMLRPLGRNKAKDLVTEALEEIQTDLENEPGN